MSKKLHWSLFARSWQLLVSFIWLEEAEPVTKEYVVNGIWSIQMGEVESPLYVCGTLRAWIQVGEETKRIPVLLDSGAEINVMQVW